jgi:RNA polymerase sigma-70 factor (ECF subfamily)
MNNQKMIHTTKFHSTDGAPTAGSCHQQTAKMDYVFRLQRDKVLRRCRQWLSQPRDAEDACQEVFFRVARAWDSFRAECKVETWLYLITRNVCRNFNRRARRRRYGQGLEYQDHIASRPALEHHQDNLTQEEFCIHRQMVEDIQSGILQLSQSSQEIMRLKIEQGLTYDEVGAHLGLPAGTIKSRVFRARSHLRAVLAGG